MEILEICYSLLAGRVFFSIYLSIYLFLSLWDLSDIELNFFPFQIKIFPFLINFFPQLSHFCKNGLDKGGGDGDGENFLIGNFAENEMACSQHV